MVTIVLLFRHEEHGTEGLPKNTLVPGAVERAHTTGVALRQRGLVIDVAFSSAQARARRTLAHVLRGMHARRWKRIWPVLEFGGSKYGEHPLTQPELDLLKSDALEYGHETAGVCAELLASLRAKMAARGQEGAVKIRSLVQKYPGQVIGIASHSETRLECTVRALAPDGPRFAFDLGGVALLTFTDPLLPPAIEYLGNLGHLSQS